MTTLSCIARVKRTNDYDYKRPPNFPLFVFASFTGDRSGSMSSMIDGTTNAPASGLYDFVTEQCKNSIIVGQECYISVTTFDDKMERVVNNVKSTKLNISYRDCVKWMTPRNSTKLYDTSIKCLNDLKKNSKIFEKSLSNESKRLNPKIVKIWALLTDGHDNASFAKSSDLHRTVTEARNEGVTCYFLAANQDACSVGENYGFSIDNSLTFDSTPEFAPRAMRAVTENVLRTTSLGVSTPFTQIQRQRSCGVNNITTIPTMMHAVSTPLPPTSFNQQNSFITPPPILRQPTMS